MYKTLIQNHPLANLTFGLVIIVGMLAYNSLPRQQDPTINFNWINIVTTMPGASAEEVEKRVTDVLEEELSALQDVSFIDSNSRENISLILIRFNELDDRLYDKRVSDLRRRIQRAEKDFPANAEEPYILEINSANAYPNAIIAVTANQYDENLRHSARILAEDIEQFDGVDRVETAGLYDPEIQIRFDPKRLEQLELNPTAFADIVSSWFTDVAAGKANLGNQAWLIRVLNKTENLEEIKKFPISIGKSEITLASIAEVERTHEKPAEKVSVSKRPAILLSVMKKAEENSLELLADLRDYLNQKRLLLQDRGIQLSLVDDQTIPTKTAIGIMQNNAIIGLTLVLLMAWLFLGFKVASLTSIGIPFILLATFFVLFQLGETLNVMVLLGVVIVLGMLVDDTVVVVEAIYYRMSRGMASIQAITEAMHEVALPVTTAVLTTIAAFLPLVLLPGILGDYMGVIPKVVSIALAISLVEAFWMLPSHISISSPRVASGDKPGFFARLSKKSAHRRRRFTHKVQLVYIKSLLKALRHPLITLTGIVLLMGLAGYIAQSDAIKKDFFAADPIRLLYVNLEMPADTPLDKTHEKLQQIEDVVLEHLNEEDYRAHVVYAGQQFTETAPAFGDHLGQIYIGLKPKAEKMRTVYELRDAMKDDVYNISGAKKISFLILENSPPVGMPIEVKVRADDYDEARRAADQVIEILKTIDGVIDISDDGAAGRLTLTLKPDLDAINRAQLDPAAIARLMRLLVDGEVVADLQSQGEKVDIRVLAKTTSQSDIAELLNIQIPTPGGKAVPLSSLLEQKRERSLSNIRHYNFRKAITVSADLRKGSIDVAKANNLLKEKWKHYQPNYPDADLNFEGQLDDVFNSMNDLMILFTVGIGLMYLVLGTQFRSYFQPLLILASVSFAFTGVTFGLYITKLPLSLYTLYGVVALTGIAVNAAIVLVSAANQRLNAGMSVIHATVYAARRRIVPVMITTLTTIAGLSSLAVGLGGKSLVWGAVATSIVFGIAFSSLLTLFVIPLLYKLFMRPKYNG